MAAIADRQAGVGGIDTHWLEAPSAAATPVLYVHGVPNGGWQWRPFLELTGGYAPDLPGFGSSDKPANFDYTIDGYARWLEAFADQLGLERFTLVVHDWGVVGLVLAQRAPERIERVAVVSAVPLLPGYEWHVVARQWRRRFVGEMVMGFTLKAALRGGIRKAQSGPVPKEFIDAIWRDFDHGTQRAILKLYRSAPEAALAAAGERLGELRCPALVVHGGGDPFISAEFAHRYAEALGGEAAVEVPEGAGHWPWLDEPALIDEIAAFVTTQGAVPPPE